MAALAANGHSGAWRAATSLHENRRWFAEAHHIECFAQLCGAHRVRQLDDDQRALPVSLRDLRFSSEHHYEADEAPCYTESQRADGDSKSEKHGRNYYIYPVVTTTKAQNPLAGLCEVASHLPSNQETPVPQVVRTVLFSA